jgi:predicted alpha/beta-hydrolase family hydrolase
MERKITFTLDDGQPFSGRLALAEDFSPGSSTVVLLAHGAANTMDHPLLVYLARELARSGLSCLRFNFPYSEAGRSKPDPQSSLEAAWHRVLARVKTDPDLAPRHVVAAGKSMGGRVASQMAANGQLSADGLIFYGYPLHPPGRKDTLRDAHLAAIEMPMLFFAGTRDPFCDLDLMRPVCQRLGDRATLEIIDGGDHSFDPPAAADPETRDQAYRRLLERSVAWIDSRICSLKGFSRL